MAAGVRVGAHLNLWKKQLGEVPESVWDRHDLESLVLADNGLVGELPKLDKLDLRWTPSLDVAALAWIAKLEARGALVYR
jgi:hypothetical protein